MGYGLREYVLTLDVALRVRALLEEQGLAVAMSRTDDGPLTDLSETDPTERTRREQSARIAAAGPARIYVSIHFNGYPDRRMRGAETYYNPDNHGEESLALARAIQGRLASEVRAAGYQLVDRGVKDDLWAGKPYGHFFSLRGDLPSVLVESMFLTNPEEAALLTRDEVRAAVASGIAEGIWSISRPLLPLKTAAKRPFRASLCQLGGPLRPSGGFPRRGRLAGDPAGV